MIKILTNIMAQLNESKKDNKGFTLVELIIVVAIIAVLATVLAPQYLQYVERSRESNDIQVAQNLMDAATVAVADPSTNVPSNSVITVTWNADGTISQVGANTDFLDSIEAVVGTDLGSPQSAKGNLELFSFVIEVSTGKITVTAVGGGTGVVDTPNTPWDQLLGN